VHGDAVWGGVAAIRHELCLTIVEKMMAQQTQKDLYYY
jgi:hypothetical protein